MTEKERLDLARAVVLVEAAIETDPRQNPHADRQVHQRARDSCFRQFQTIGCRCAQCIAPNASRPGRVAIYLAIIGRWLTVAPARGRLAARRRTTRTWRMR